MGEPIGKRLADCPDTQAEQAEMERMLAQAMERLPERERLVVTLYDMEDRRLKEMGELLKRSESRVSRVLSAALFNWGEHLRAREH